MHAPLKEGYADELRPGPQFIHVGCWSCDFIAHRNAAIPITMIDHSVPIIPRCPPRGMGAHPIQRFDTLAAAVSAVRGTRAYILMNGPNDPTFYAVATMLRRPCGEPWPRYPKPGPWCATTRYLALF